MGKEWFVNAPGSKSPSYRSKRAAKRAAKSVKGAKVSRHQTHSGKHSVSDSSKGGCAVTALAFLAVPVTVAGYLLDWVV